MTVFDTAFRAVIGEEGGLTTNPADPGNWTGGKRGVGECRGTKYGVSSGAYPSLDIANLTLDQAKAIYRRDYWDRVHGDDLPPALALLTFDAAVNSGPGRAVRWLQAALGVPADGVIGPQTLSATKSRPIVAATAEFQAQRLMFMSGLSQWPTFGLGWTRRVCRMMAAALALADQQEAATQEKEPEMITLENIKTAVREVLAEKPLLSITESVP